jgi:hypothetical protein
MIDLIIRLGLLAALGWPQLMGLATHYDCDVHCGRVMRSGIAYAPDAAVCAVDTSLWQQWRGKTLLVVAQNGKMLQCKVMDSGYLYRAGRWEYGIKYFGKRSIARWWPSQTGYRIVVDIPEETFRQLAPDGDTVLVGIWVIQDDRKVSDGQTQDTY